MPAAAVLYGALLLAEAALALPERRLASVEVVSVPWNVQTRTALTEQTIGEIAIARRTSVTDPEALEQLEERLTRLRATVPAAAVGNLLPRVMAMTSRQAAFTLSVPRRRSAPEAVRIVATLAYDDGGDEQLVVPESCRAMRLGGTEYAFDEALFRWLKSQLSPHERDVLKAHPYCARD